jgi:hypothetical protein
VVSDRREFIRLDVGYFDNPKVADVLDESPAAVVLHIASMAHARQHRTDGIVSRKQILRKVGATETDAKLLIDLGLWHDVGDGKIEVHDYAKHQETREEIEARSKVQRENARKRWDARRSAERNADGTFRADGNASGSANGIAGRNAEERRGEERREEGPVVVSPARNEPRDAHYEDDRSPLETVSPETVLPRNFVASTRHKAFAGERGLDIAHELAAFKAHAKANARTLVDWDAGFNVWLLSAAKRAKDQAGAPRPGSSAWDRDVTGQGTR